MATAKQVVAELRSESNAKKATDLQRFFKTGPGEYAEGDLFLGVMVPQTRATAKKYKSLPLTEIRKLTESIYHEVRFCGLLILISQYQSEKLMQNRKKYFDFYLRQLRAGFINNWDLIDVTGVRMGTYLLDQKDSIEFLRRLAKSKNLWQRRMSVIFTFAFQRAGNPHPTLEIADLLIDDKHDLIHKAVGWALREVGKMDGPLLRSYLKENAHVMPRTMLRYAIEKFPPTERKKWLEYKPINQR